MPAQAFFAPQMASDACLDVAPGAAGVDVAPSGEVEDPQFADGQAHRGCQPDL